MSQNSLHWIDLIMICPLRPKSAGSGPTRAPTRRQKFLALQTRAHAPPRAARSFWLSGHAPPRADQRVHAPSRAHASTRLTRTRVHAPTRAHASTRLTRARASRAHQRIHAPHAHTPLTRLTRTRATRASCHVSPNDRRRSPLTAAVDQKKKKKHCPSRFFA